jgi:hypothetical protein
MSRPRGRPRRDPNGSVGSSVLMNRDVKQLWREWCLRHNLTRQTCLERAISAYASHVYALPRESLPRRRPGQNMSRTEIMERALLFYCRN